MAWNEHILHELLRKQFSHVGDDAALVSFKNSKLVFCSDAMEEGVHFCFDWMTPSQLAYKLLAVNLSDIAAMGANPRWALLSLALPRKTPFTRVKQFFKALKKYCLQFKVQLLGGDSDASDKWRLSLTLVGEAKEVVLRKGAQVDDDIWVSGTPGYSALGLFALQNQLKDKKYKAYVKKHLQPIPRLKEAFYLSNTRLASAMIDVSDGLWLDLERLCASSSVGAEIKLPHYRNWPESLIHKMPHFIASGGEDYELLFTTSPKNKFKVLHYFKTLHTPLQYLGKIKNKNAGVKVFSFEGKPFHSKKGYQHF